MKIKIQVIFLLLIIIVFSNIIQAQDNFVWDFEIVSKVKITDKNYIEQLVLELFIPESDIDYIEIFDVDDNGPTENDLIRVSPSKVVYPMGQLSQKCHELLQKIPQKPNEIQVGKTVNIDKEPESAEDKILYILGVAIESLYSLNKPLKLFFEQDEHGGFKYYLLGYREESFKDSADVSFGKITEANVQGLLKALYRKFSKEYRGFQPTVVRIREVIRDTIYVPYRQ